MNKDSYIFKILEDLKSYPMFELFFTTMEDKDQEKLLSLIRNMDINKLYPGLIHGRYHSEKVLLFAYILGVELGLSDEQMKILCDAAMYHDFMRMDDREDNLHGLAAANNIDKIFWNDPFYKEGNRKKILQAIIDNHSASKGRNDDCQFIIFENYELDQTDADFGEFQLLAHALLDADALDRMRFSKASPAYLRPEFLKYDFSKMLMQLSEEVNEAYKNFDNYKEIDFSELERLTGAVCHSAGFVFSRIPFILKYGVLSKSEQDKKNVTTHRNFDGGNSIRWISVVPVELLGSDNKSNAAFMENGIVVKTRDVEYYKSRYGTYDANIAQPKGLPYVKGGYPEERFVFERINPEDIEELYISNKCANKDISDLNYIFPNLDYLAYEKMINYLMDEYKASPSDRSEVIVLLKKYVSIIKEYFSYSSEQRMMKKQEFYDNIVVCNGDINKKIALIIKKAYTQRFGVFHKFIKITPVMVLEDQLLISGIHYEKVINEDRVSFIINPKKDKDLSDDIKVGSK
jgi:hypothetical protein